MIAISLSALALAITHAIISPTQFISPRLVHYRRWIERHADAEDDAARLGEDSRDDMPPASASFRMPAVYR